MDDKEVVPPGTGYDLVLVERALDAASHVISIYDESAWGGEMEYAIQHLKSVLREIDERAWVHQNASNDEASEPASAQEIAPLCESSPIASIPT